MLPRGLLKEYASVLSFVARVFDVLCILLGALLAYTWRFDHWPMPANYQMAILLGVLFTLMFFSVSGVYGSWRGKSWLHQAQTITLAWFSVVALLIIVAFLTKTGTLFSRQWMVVWVISAWSLLLLFRFSLTIILRAMRKKGWNHKRIIIVGAGSLGQSVAQNILDADWTGLEVVGFLDDGESLRGHWIKGVEVLGGAGKANLAIQQKSADEIWLALPLKAEDRVKEILYDLRHSTATIRFVPGIFGFRLLNHSVTDVAGMAVMDLSASPMVGLNRAIKAVEDRVLALLILVLISPLLAFVALGVKFSSPGPMLFKQKRHGWDGKPIKIYKFRSMVVHCEDGDTVTQARKCDYRITKFGAFLRRTSLDELPQFVNVLQGKMSIVGPRPHAIAHNEQYKDQIEAYMLRHKVKPGITGWAQVNGWRGETDTLDKMRKRVEYDLYYIENWSLWFDIKIIIRTVFTGFTNKNAY
ncbi:MAG: undecaprenyl-phosphate glucose phosphotransferase [Gammaproteobacteria bacterium]|nr:undecaprenyl-phosphate glucose phosphotransferase [Gammaproteobacteria bacterium]MCF6261895.1 undecaprenyl-phosphate glucose phosphotransferase [Gammaproteobacteria bacterium]